MKPLKTLAVALGAAVLGTTGLYAQAAAVVDVPFDFTVQSATMSAGKYKLWAPSMSNPVIQIRNTQTGKSAFVLASGSSSTQVGDRTTGKVIFHRYGDRYFFSEVWTPDAVRGRALPSKLEQEYQARNAEKQLASVSIPLAAAP
jgi:hypothetical protein